MKKVITCICVVVMFFSTGLEVFAARPNRCVRGNPILNIWFSSSPVDPGRSGSIMTQIGNGDSIECPSSSFKLSVNMPQRWRPKLQPAGNLTLPAGATIAEVYQQIDYTVPNRAQERIYSFVVKLKNKTTGRMTQKTVIIEVGNTPIITSMTPTSGPPGTRVLLTGRNFGPMPEVAFQNNTDGQHYFRYVPSNGSTYEFYVPQTISKYSCGCREVTPPGEYSVLIGNNGTYSNIMNFTVTR